MCLYFSDLDLSVKWFKPLFRSIKLTVVGGAQTSCMLMRRSLANHGVVARRNSAQKGSIASIFARLVTCAF